MKRVTAAAAAVLLLLTTSGCSLPSTELENRLIVSAVGIDKADDGYTVTLSYLSMRARPDEDAVLSSDETTSTGLSLHEAFSDAESKIRGSLFWGHTSYVVLSERAARDSIDEILEFVCKNSDIGIDVGVCAVRGSASEALKARVMEQEGISKSFDNVLNNEDLSSKTYTRLFEIVRDIGDGGCSGILPVLEYSARNDAELSGEDGREGVSGVFELAGVAVFTDGRQCGFVSGDNLDTLAAMLSRGRELSLEFEFGDLTVYAAVEYPSVSFFVKDKGTIGVDVSAQLDISDVLKNGRSCDDYSYSEVKRACEEQTEKRVSEVFFTVYRELGADLFRLRTAYEMRFGREAANRAFGDDIELSADVSVRLRAAA